MTMEELVFNGLDAETGDYLLPPMTAEELARIVRDERAAKPPDLPKEPVERELEWRQRQVTEAMFAPEEGVDPKDLSQTGWGVVFPATAGDSLRGALAELLDYRKGQAGALYRECIFEKGYQPGDTKSTFLARHGASAGLVSPELMPYYLLIVGSPADIPYVFQYELDVPHSVGRIWFDTEQEYRSYASSVVAAERRPARAPAAVFAGVKNPGDRATELSATELITPLATHVAGDKPDWRISTLLEQETTKERLMPLFGGSETPALLFTASHGAGFSASHPLQRRHQGALICQDWPGRDNHTGPIPETYYISADDITEQASLLGLISFHFACYGAGTPKMDDFWHAKPLQERKALASEAFMARLPQRLLGHPNGGALAAIGHIDRAWGYSFRSEGGKQLTSFESMLKRLMEGHPVGSAMEPFNSYYAEVATELTSIVQTAMYMRPDSIDNAGIASLWTRHNDARAYAIVGDPAVRINVPANGSHEPNPYIIPTGNVSESESGSESGQSTAPPSAGETSPSTATGTPGSLGQASRPPEAPESTTSSTTITAPTSPARLTIRVDFDERATLRTNAAMSSTGGEQEFGFFDSASDVKETVTNLVKSVAQAVQTALSDVASLRVVTYTSESLDQVDLDLNNKNFSGPARMRAITHLSADGDTLLCLPEEDGEVDERIWAIHSEAVAHAQAYRADLIKSVLSATAGLIPK